jgi:hypothetical protein
MTFEQIYKIPEGHTLKKVREKLRSFDDDWTHEEYNRKGQLVARYESWDYRAPKTTPRVGWRKLGPDGTVLEEHNDLPL